MSFQVGDVCEFVGRPIGPISALYAGTQCTVVQLAVATGLFGEMHQCEMYDGAVAKIAAMFLRKKPPKQPDHAEPRTDFTPANGDDWELTHWHPKKTRETA